MSEKITIEMKADGLEMDTNRQQFALAVKTWRLRQNLTQREVAERWDMSRRSIIRAENGQPMSWEQTYRMFVALSDELRKEAQI